MFPEYSEWKEIEQGVVSIKVGLSEVHFARTLRLILHFLGIDGQQCVVLDPTNNIRP